MLFGDERVCACVCRQWLEDAMKENDPSSVLLFLVGTKKDLSVGEIEVFYIEKELKCLVDQSVNRTQTKEPRNLLFFLRFHCEFVSEFGLSD